jgi:uncharacterized protein (TIGR03437 family)
MSSFRKLVFLTFLLVAGTRIVSAQTAPFGCKIVDQPPPTLRGEGLTELAGDVLMRCTGGVANTAAPVQIAFFANTSLTNRSVGSGLSDVLLLVDEPAPSAIALGVNAFKGQLAGNGSTWNVSLIQPGSGTRTLRITNIRTYANQVSGGPSSQAVTLVGGIQMISAGTTTTVGSTVLGSVLFSAGIDFRRCDDLATAGVTLPLTGGLNTGLLQAAGSGRISLNVRFTEAFATVFRNQQQESGTTLSAADSTGKADHGTRLALNINNVPQGVRVFVTTAAVNDGAATSSALKATLVSSASGPLNAVASTATGACVNTQVASPMAEVALSNGTGNAVWEIMAADQAALDHASFGVAFAYPDTVLPLGFPTFSAGLAPAASPNRITDFPSFVSSTFFQNLPASSQTGLTFIGVASGATIPTQTLKLPTGASQVSVSTTDGGKWLSAAIAGGSINVSINATGLAAADYYGQVTSTNSQGAVLGVSFVVLYLVTQSPGPIVYPQGLIFPAFAGDQQTDPQNILLTNLNGQPVTYTQTNPARTGTLPPGQQVSVPVTVNVTGQAPGEYTTSTSFSFSDGTSRTVIIKTIVAPLPGSPTPTPTCTYTLTPATLNVAAASSTDAVQLQTAAGCAWTIAGLPSWIAVSGASSGSGPATINLSIASNTGGARSAGVTIGGVALAVNQAAGSSGVSTSYTITTFAGTGTPGYGGDNGPATSGVFNEPAGLAADSSGNVYIADYTNDAVRKVSNGKITTLTKRGSPAALAVDAAGNLYVTQFLLNCISKVSSGVVIIVAGTCYSGGNSGENVPATTALFETPYGVALDAPGNLYIADFSGSKIRKVDTNGIITTVAGTGTSGDSGDNGPAISALLTKPLGVAVDSRQNIYVADNSAHRVRVISNGIIYTIAGNGAAGSSSDGATTGAGTVTQLNAPGGLAVGPNGVLYIVERGSNRVRTWTPSTVPGAAPNVGVLGTLAGNGEKGYSGDNGPATAARFNNPSFVAVDPSGKIYVSDTGNNVVRLLTPITGSGCTYAIAPATLNAPAAGVTQAVQLQTASGCVWTVTGLPAWISASPAVGSGPSTINLTAAANTGASRAATVSIVSASLSVTQAAAAGVAPAYTITTFAGQGTQSGFAGDNGPATSALLTNVAGVAVDGKGTVYIADNSNHRVRQVSGGTIATLAGTGVQGAGPDNVPPSVSSLNGPGGVAVDKAGNLFIADASGHCVRKVSATATGISGSTSLANGVITTVAGLCEPFTFLGDGSFGGDGGPATGSTARLNSPFGLALDAAGNLYIADSGNNRIRKVDTGGIITTVAGNGSGGFGGDNGPATNAQLSSPAGVAVDSSGRIYIADLLNNRIRMVANGTISTLTSQVNQPFGVAISPSGVLYIADTGNGLIRQWDTGVLSTIAGNGKTGFSGDGAAATSASFNFPAALAIDANGKIYVSDTSNAVVRVLTPGFAPAALTAAPGALTAAPAASPTQCAPNALYAVFQQIGYVSILNVGWPQTVQARIYDSCSQPMLSGVVTVRFSNQDDIVTLTATGGIDGVWSGEWAPTHYASQVTATLTATEPDINLSTTEATTVGLANTDVPIVTAAGVVSAANNKPDLAPGTAIAIYGSALATGINVFSGLPLPKQLGPTKVSLSGVPLPLIFTSAGQIDAVIPFVLQPLQPYQLVVQRGLATSTAVTVTLQPVRPSLFYQQNAGNQGAIVHAGTATLADASSPVKAGDYIEIYCTGLGAVYPLVTAGTAAPSDPPSQVSSPAVTVTVDGKPASVTFAGLTPGTVGLYQVDAIVPSGVSSGDSVPVVVSVSGQASLSATIAVR